MLNQKTIGIVVGIVGVVVGVVSLLADALGITDDPNSFDLETIGTLQIVGIVVGIVVLITGLAIYRYGSRLLGRTQAGS